MSEVSEKRSEVPPGTSVNCAETRFDGSAAVPFTNCTSGIVTAPVAGTSGFAEQFARMGPRDKKGRSLRDLDLKTRLFRYPLSYLIYSEAFDALPVFAKDHIYDRLREILNGTELDHLSAADRKAILEILKDTKPGW